MMKEAELFMLVSRLVATLGRIVVLARLRRQGFMVVVVCSLLTLVCKLVDAIERSLRESAE